MKATGIVRRIDDLGRVVIPKEIRRTMRIRVGEPLEIFTSNEGEVVFKKYSPLWELGHFAGDYIEVLYKQTGLILAITDRDHITSVAGISKKEFVEKKISPSLEEMIGKREEYIFENNEIVFPLENTSLKALMIYPIMSNGDIHGCIMAMCVDDVELKPISEVDRKLIETAGMFLSNQIEQ